MKNDPEMSELTSIIMISCFEIYVIGKFLSYIWRLLYDNQLSIIMTKLETIHEQLLRLNMVGPINIKINLFYVIGIIGNVMDVILQTHRMINIVQNIITNDLVTLLSINIFLSL